MRAIAIALLFAALPLTGCFGGDDDPAPPPTTTTPTTTPTNMTPTPTNGTGPTPTPTGPSTPAPREVCTGSVNFARPPLVPPATQTTTEPCSIPAGYTSITLNVTFTPTDGAPVGASQGVQVALVDEAGTEIASCAAPATGQAAETVCSATGTIPAAGGEYNLAYTGEGTWEASASVVAS